MIDFGYRWSVNERGFPNYRLTWDETTGELFVFNCSTGDEQVVAMIEDRITLDLVLEDWPEMMVQPDSLTALERRLSIAADSEPRVSFP